jgi:hypothetical protein
MVETIKGPCYTPKSRTNLPQDGNIRVFNINGHIKVLVSYRTSARLEREHTMEKLSRTNGGTVQLLVSFKQ